jgi:hypothetical protein
MNRWHAHLTIVSLVFLLIGCAQTALTDLGHKIRDSVATQIPYKVMPTNTEAGALRSVLLIPDRTREAQQMAASMESEMTQLRIDERPYYANIKLAPPNNDLSDVQRQALGKAALTDAVITLYGGHSKVSQSTFNEERSKCNTESNKLFAKCPTGQMSTYKVNCTKWTATAGASMRVQRVSDARSILVTPLSESVEKKSCSDSEEGNPDQQSLAANALAKAITKAMTTIAPSYSKGPLDLMDADKSINEDALKRFNAAVKFAQARRMDEACTRFDEIYSDMKESPALTFNVAFCKEIRGEMLLANQGYKRASELLNKPDSQIDRRITLTEKAIRDNSGVFASADLSTQAQGLPAGHGQRVALVIGNARYERSALINPVNDARLIGNQLKKAGFDVFVFENLNSARFATVVSDFAQKAKGAEVALFYYAGHAIQSEGENYLLPVNNAKIRNLEDVRESGVQLGMVTAQLDVAAPTVKLYVIDACRDSPLPASSRSLSGGGLASIKTPPEGSLVAYATAPGKTAEDGTGKNSVFSKHLAQQILKPNQTIEQVFKNVRNAVKTETKNRQEPMEVSSLSGNDMFFVKSK